LRNQKAKKRPILSDPVYRSRTVNRFINNLMVDGKKSISRSIVYGLLEKLNEDKKEALKIFEDSVQKVMPKLELKSKRVGGATYQVPMLIKHNRSQFLGIKWIIDSSRARKGVPIVEKLYQEFTAIQKGEGSNALKKKQDVQKMADANKAYSSYR